MRNKFKLKFRCDRRCCGFMGGKNSAAYVLSAFPLTCKLFKYCTGPVYDLPMRPTFQNKVIKVSFNELTYLFPSKLTLLHS